MGLPTLVRIQFSPLILRMGFFTIWISLYFICLRICILVITLIIPFSNKGKFNTWFSYFFYYRVISWIFFLMIAFTYPEFFLYYFIEKAKTPFFVTDANLLAFHLFQNILFFSWIFYFPSIFYGLFYLFKHVFTVFEYQKVFRLCFYIIYLHFLAILVTHFDIFYFFQNYFNSSIGSWFERADYSSHLTLYRGTFFDVWFSFVFLWFYCIVMLESKFNAETTRYTFKKDFFAIVGSPKKFWNSFTFYWIFRIFTYLLVFYFFTGEGFFSDTVVLLVTIIFCELTIIFIRSRFVLASWKDV